MNGSGLLLLGIELGQSTPVPPKLYEVSVCELPAVFLGGVIVGAHKLDCSHHAALWSKDIHAVLGHRIHPSTSDGRIACSFAGRCPERNTSKRTRRAGALVAGATLKCPQRILDSIFLVGAKSLCQSRIAHPAASNGVCGSLRHSNGRRLTQCGGRTGQDGVALALATPVLTRW